MNQNTTQETIDLVKATLADPLAKSVNMGGGLFGVDVTAPAKNLIPIYTPLRNKIARRGGGFGSATNWRTVTALNGSGYNSMPWIPEGQRSAVMSYSTAPKAANYVTIGEEDNYTFEYQSASQGGGFEGEPAMVITRLLQKLMLKEENAIIGGNASLALGTPSTPTLSASGTGGTLPAATYSVIVVALTQEALGSGGGNGVNIANVLSNGVPTSKTVTGADGNTYTLNGGSSNKSANATQAVTAGQTLTATVSYVNGACAYAWYVGAAGSEKLQAITTINMATFSAPLSSTGQAATAITADCSSNNGLAYDGLLSVALNPANGSYVNTLAAGSGLTGSGHGSIVEIDNALKAMWDAYQLSATAIYVSSQEQKNIATKCLSSSQGSLIRFDNVVGSGQPGAVNVAAGQMISSYYNPFMPNGGQIIPILIHPAIPAGTILLACHDLPAYYQNSQVGNVAEIRTRRDYYQVDWPLRTRKQEMGVYAEEVLAVYAPFAFGVINNINNV